MAVIVWCINIFHLTWPTSPPYFVKVRCSKLLHTCNTGFIAIRLLKFGVTVKKVYTVTTTFLLRDHWQTCTGRPRKFFCVSTGRRPGSLRTKHCRFPGARERRETRCRLSAYVRVREAHFKHEFWQFWADMSWQLIILLYKQHLSLLYANSVVR